MRKILVAPTAYKGTFSPAAVAYAIADGLKETRADFEITTLPLADGGDGTIESINFALGGKLYEQEVLGPNGTKVIAKWLKVANTAVIELASASGLSLVSSPVLQPLTNHTFGTGQLLKNCLEAGERDIVIAVGGSASVDGGTGILHALGARFLDADNQELPLGGGALTQLVSCDLTLLANLPKARIKVACDVNNPLLGKNGAAHTFGPQKGATEIQCQLLDNGLEKLAKILEKATGNQLSHMPGTGAAGGAAFGLACALNAKIMPGFPWLSELIELPGVIARSDLIITGEGTLDQQSFMGKSTGYLAKLCQMANKPLWVIAARVQPGVDWQKLGIKQAISVTANDFKATLEEIRAVARKLISGS